MRTKVNRRTVDLTAFPDLVVIYLGMRVNAMTGLKTVIGFGPKIARSVDARPEGLLLHENLIFSLFPPHVVCGSTGTVSKRSRTWQDQTRIACGGSSFSRTRVVQASGMKPTSCVAAWRPSMTTW